jgi:hypothetical protein
VHNASVLHLQALLKVTLPVVETKQQKQPADGAAQPASQQGAATASATASAKQNNVIPFSRRLRESGAGAARASRGGDRAAMPGIVSAGARCEEWRPGQRKFLQEPMFVARPGSTAEDDGWIIVGVHNAETMRGEIAILDAQR